MTQNYKRQLTHAILLRILVLGLFLLLGAIFIPRQAATAPGAMGFPAAPDREPVKVTAVVVTAYSSDVAQTDATPCIPASGYDLCKHYEEHGFGNTIAANFLPLGTQVRIPELFGDKVFIVRDRMNERYATGRIDVWMPTKAEAKQFGVKRATLEQFGGGMWRWQLARSK